MNLITILLQLPFLIVAGLLTLYILIITVAPFLIIRARKPVVMMKRKFAIIIPADNEEKVLEQTLARAQTLRYPGELYDVIVVADNCTDKTAKIALAKGAIVFERSDESRQGKGYALNWIIPQVLGRLPQYDACIFIDADSLIAPDFLAQMNISLQEGHKVVQSSDLVFENRASWRAQVALIALALQNYARPMGKSRLGLSTPLKGNGMCFAVDILKTIRWDDSSLTEDLDMSIELIRRGVKIHFNPDAIVHAIMPTTGAGATTQRMRWEAGRFRSIRRKVIPLVREAWHKKSIQIFETIADLVFPPLVLFLCIAGFFAGMNAVLLQAGLVTTTVMFWGWTMIIGGLVAHCILGVIVARVHPRNLLAFLYMPLFFIWKITVYIRMIGRKSTKAWVRTAR